MNKNHLYRGIALIIDSFLINLISSVFIYKDLEFKGISISIVTISFINSVFFFYILYFLFFDLVNQGQTVGKALVGIKMSSTVRSFMIKRTLVFRTLLKVLCLYLIPITIIFYFFKGKFPQDTFFNIETIRE